MLDSSRLPYLSIGSKLALWLCLVLAATGIATAIELSEKTRERLVEGKLTAANMVADLFAASVAPALDFDDHEELVQEASKLGKNPEIVYSAVFMAGSPDPIAEWAKNQSQVNPRAPTHSSAEVFPDHIAVSRVMSTTSGRPLGSLVLHASLARENERFVEARKRIIEYTGIVTSLLVLGMLLVTSRTVTKPLRRLALAARRLEQGRAAEPVTVRANDEIGQLGGAFNAMAAAIADRERRLAELNRELMQLLDGMRQGILVFERGGVLRTARSHEAQVIFDEESFEGLTIQSLLYRGGSRDVAAEAFEEWIAVAFACNPADWEQLVELAPDEVVIDGARGERILSLDFRPIEIEGRIDRIMMLATDETEKRHLQRAVKQLDEEHEKQMAAMRRLVAGGGQLLVSVLDRARDRFVACEDVLGTAPPALDASLVEQLFQHVHSVKGEARAFDLTVLEAATAELEDFLAILRGRLRAGQLLPLAQVRPELAERFSSAQQAVLRAGEMLVEASPIGEAILHQVTVQREDVEGLIRVAGSRRDELGTLVNRLAARPFGELLLGLAEAVPRWATREQKRACIDVEGRKVRIPAALSRVLPDVLAHLVRNALAHGIETTADRVSAGKEELSRIRIAAVETPAGPSVSVEDDGRGFDADAILQRAGALGLAGGDVSRLVFESGLSTAEGSELAGRGVGLAAVKADLELIGYAITLHSRATGLKITMSPRGMRPPRLESRTGVS